MLRMLRNVFDRLFYKERPKRLTPEQLSFDSNNPLNGYRRPSERVIDENGFELITPEIQWGLRK